MTEIFLRYTEEGTFEPLDRSRRYCHATFTPHRIYKLEPVFDRDMNSHGHQFAWLNEAFANLPERYAWLKNAKQFRRYLLIKRGFCHAETTVFADPEEALRFAARLRKIDERLKDFSMVTVEDCVVTQYTAESQSRKETTPARFREQKKAILEEAEHMLGVEKGSLEQEARPHA